MFLWKPHELQHKLQQKLRRRYSDSYTGLVSQIFKWPRIGTHKIMSHLFIEEKTQTTVDRRVNRNTYLVVCRVSVECKWLRLELRCNEVSLSSVGRTSSALFLHYENVETQFYVSLICSRTMSVKRHVTTRRQNAVSCLINCNVNKCVHIEIVRWGSLRVCQML